MIFHETSKKIIQASTVALATFILYSANNAPEAVMYTPAAFSGVFRIDEAEVYIATEDTVKTGFFKDFSERLSEEMPTFDFSGNSGVSNSDESYESLGDFMTYSEENDEPLIEVAENFNGYENISEQRQIFVNVAKSYEGQIRYVWGAKPVASESYNPTKTGLDCSGFVQYIYYFTTDRYESALGSTLNIAGHAKQISADELRPGDLGMIRLDGSYYTVKNSNEKYYDERKAKAFVNSYNEHLREISWVDVEYEDTYEEEIEEEVELTASEIEAYKQNYYDEWTREYVASHPAPEPVAPPEPAEGEEGEGGEYIPPEPEPYVIPDPPEPTVPKTKKVKKTVEKTVTRIERESTLNEADLLKKSDIVLHSNHVGIYVGLDENGNQIWCHCAGSSLGNTVVIGEYPGFKCYFRIFE